MNNQIFSLAVLNPGGRDADQDFFEGAGQPDAKIHAPVNYHGYAAAASGSFLKSVEAVQKRAIKNVILLLRSDLKTSFAVLQKLQAQGCRVFISFKESGYIRWPKHYRSQGMHYYGRRFAKRQTVRFLARKI